jgi:hypothetical protein
MRLMQPLGDHRIYGYMGSAGRIIIEPQFRWAADFKNGLAPVSTEAHGASRIYIETVSKPPAKMAGR